MYEKKKGVRKELFEGDTSEITWGRLGELSRLARSREIG